MTEPIEPCPNPGCEPGAVRVQRTRYIRQVWCVDCWTHGPAKKREDLAIAAWNALARAVREATGWRQRAEAAEAERDALRNALTAWLPVDPVDPTDNGICQFCGENFSNRSPGDWSDPARHKSACQWARSARMAYMHSPARPADGEKR